MPVTQTELLTASFPHAVGNISLRETHLSIVVLTGELAYKIKKAVKLEFIDASTLEQRRRLCEEELRLNRRIAPDLYLDVTPVSRGVAGLEFGGGGEPIEYAVRMRQFGASDELHALLAAHAVSPDEVARLGTRVAEFHRGAARLEASALEATRAFLDAVRANLEGVDQRAARVNAAPQAAELRRFMERELSARLERLRDREREGAVRECHGDLHARNIVRWRSELMPFDCLEFDPALRFIDPLSDVAFLVMDFLHYDRLDLGFAFLNRWLEASGDYAALDLLPCYLEHRALVRAKVNLIEVEQHPGNAEARSRALARLRTAKRVAELRTPTLIVMHGASGSGKSWLSERLAPEIGAVRIRSDLERKRLAGLDPLAPRASELNAGIYTLEFNERTYDRLLECARASLRGRLSTIIDAAFLKRSERDAFAELAQESRARFRIVTCRADPDTLAARIEARRAAAADPSDATVEVLRHQLGAMQPFGAEEETHVIEADTRDPDVLNDVIRRVSEQRAADSG